MDTRQRHEGRQEYDPWRMLAAAVIHQAIKDLDHPERSGDSGRSTAAEDQAERVHTAREFLAGDMWPYAEMIDLEPDSATLGRYCRQRGIARD